MAGNGTAVLAANSSTSSGARARSSARRRRCRRRVQRGEKEHKPKTPTVLVGDLSRNMAAGCCSAKKQRLNVSSRLSMCDSTVRQNGSQLRKSVIAKPEMGFFCFDVLYCQLHQLESPKPPNFINEALWVKRCFPSFFLSHSYASFVSLARAHRPQLCILVYLCFASAVLQCKYSYI